MCEVVRQLEAASRVWALLHLGHTNTLGLLLRHGQEKVSARGHGVIIVPSIMRIDVISTTAAKMLNRVVREDILGVVLDRC